MKEPTIYKSAEGRQKFQAYYQQALERLDFPYESVNVATKFGNTHVLVAGKADAPPLLLMHGVGANAPIAFLAAPELVKHYRVYAPDMVGQSGRSAEVRPNIKDNSYGEWMADFLDGLELEKVPIVAVSYGGFATLRLAAYQPQRIEKLVLVVPAGIVNSPVGASITRVALPMLRYRMFPNDKNLEKFISAFITDTQEWEWADFQRDLFRHMKMDLRKPPLAKVSEMQGLKAPVYIIGAEDDVFFPIEKILKRAKNLFPNFKAGMTIPNSKHAPPFDYPPLNKAMLEYLAS